MNKGLDYALKLTELGSIFSFVYSAYINNVPFMEYSSIAFIASFAGDKILNNLESKIE